MRLLLGSLASLAVGSVAYGVLVEANDFQVRRVEQPILPAGSPSVRVLHISDVHLLSSQKQKRDFLRGLNGLNPDLVVCTGDLVSSPLAIEALAESLGPLLDVPGVFVFGSNDYHLPTFKIPIKYLWRSTGKTGPSSDGGIPTAELRAALQAGAWRDVTDVRVQLELRGVPFEIRGTGDAHQARDDYSTVAGAVRDDVVSLGVTHAPYLRLLDAMTADGVDLILAGHTHGGQVCVPVYGALATNCDLPTVHAKGLFRHRASGRESLVNVSAGIGTSPFAPYRFACQPEVSLLTLTAPSATDETQM